MDKARETTYHLLRWSERYFKTDMVYLAKGGFWLTISQILTSASSLILAIALANILPKDAYGSYKYILSLTGILSIFTLPGIETAVTQAIAKGLDGSFKTGLVAKLRWGVITAVISLLASGYYLVNGNLEIGVSLLLAAIFLPLINAFDLYNSILQGKREFRLYTWCNSLTQIVTTAMLVIAVLVNQHIITIVSVFFIGNAAMNFVCFWLTKKRLTPLSEADPQTVTYGKHLTAISVLNLLVDQLDQILIFHFLGAAELAIYALATAPTDQIKAVVKNIPFLAFPKLAQRSTANRGQMLRKTWLIGTVVSAMVFVYIIIAPWFFGFFFPKYLVSVPYSQILSLSIIFIAPAIFLFAYFESQAMTRQIYQYNTFYNIINIIFLLPLIYYFGLWGAIFAKLLARFFTLVYTTAVFARQR